MALRRRSDSRIWYGLTAVVVLALIWTTISLVSSPPASADEVPGPLLLAGSDCDENGPFVQYRVTNQTDRGETLTISIDSEPAIGSAAIGSDETKRGRIEWRGSPAKSVVLEARWATNADAPISIITVAPNPCVGTSSKDFTGPAFMAGTECRDDQAILRWWMANSAEEHRKTYVSIGSEDGSTGETIWPSDGSNELMFAGAQTGGVAPIPSDYPPGSILRVSGWAEGSFGIAETWTEMVIPICSSTNIEIAGETTLDGTGTSLLASETTVDPLTAILSSSPPVATTVSPGDGTTTTIFGETTTTLPGETTTTTPGQTTTTTPGQTTTTTPGQTTTTTPGQTTTTSTSSTTTTTTTGPPGSTTTTTRPPTTTTTTTTTTTAPPGGDISSPVFLAGADCGANGAFIRYRVTNNNSTTQTLQVTFNGSTRVSSVSVSGGQSKWGTFTASGDAEARPVVASWVGVSGSAAPTLLMRASICSPDLPQPARGPSFVAGQDCSGGTPIVRWWMKNSAPTTQPMNVTITQANNSGERTVWPSGGGTVDVDPEVQTAGVYTLPSGYNVVGQEIRMRGWWRELDANAHNRVGIVIASCG